MLSKNLKKLTYRLHYRGIKELDIFFGRAQSHLDIFSESEVKILRCLMEEEEDKIYQWLLNSDTRPNQYQHIIDKILTL